MLELQHKPFFFFFNIYSFGLWICLFMSLFLCSSSLGPPECVWYGCSVAAGAGCGRKVSRNGWNWDELLSRELGSFAYSSRCSFAYRMGRETERVLICISTGCMERNKIFWRYWGLLFQDDRSIDHFTNPRMKWRQGQDKKWWSEIGRWKEWWSWRENDSSEVCQGEE